jgi:hypothetical protein
MKKDERILDLKDKLSFIVSNDSIFKTEKKSISLKIYDKENDYFNAKFLDDQTLFILNRDNDFKNQINASYQVLENNYQNKRKEFNKIKQFYKYLDDKKYISAIFLEPVNMKDYKYYYANELELITKYNIDFIITESYLNISELNNKNLIIRSDDIKEIIKCLNNNYIAVITNNKEEVLKNISKIKETNIINSFNRYINVLNKDENVSYRYNKKITLKQIPLSYEIETNIEKIGKYVYIHIKNKTKEKIYTSFDIFINDNYIKTVNEQIIDKKIVKLKLDNDLLKIYDFKKHDFIINDLNIIELISKDKILSKLEFSYTNNNDLNLKIEKTKNSFYNDKLFGFYTSNLIFFASIDLILLVVFGTYDLIFLHVLLILILLASIIMYIILVHNLKKKHDSYDSNILNLKEFENVERIVPKGDEQNV